MTPPNQSPKQPPKKSSKQLFKQRIFDYAGRQLIISCGDLLSSNSEVIVVPVSSRLIAQQEITKLIVRLAGAAVQDQIDRLRHEYTEFETGMAVFTEAGQLSYAAIIHAVGYAGNDLPEQSVCERSFTNSLLLCEFNQWNSVAFARLYDTDQEREAVAAARAIIRFWDARMSSSVSTVVLHVPLEQFDIYSLAVEKINAGPLASASQFTAGYGAVGDRNQAAEDQEQEVGELDLSNEDLKDLDDPNISDWFK